VGLSLGFGGDFDFGRRRRRDNESLQVRSAIGADFGCCCFLGQLLFKVGVGSVSMLSCLFDCGCE